MMEPTCDIKTSVGRILAGTYDPHFLIEENERGRRALYFTAHDPSTFHKLKNLFSRYPDPDRLAAETTKMFTRKVMQYMNTEPTGDCKWSFDQFMDKLGQVLDTLIKQIPDKSSGYWLSVEQDFTHLMTITQRVPVYIGDNSEALNQIIDEVCETIPDLPKSTIPNPLSDSTVTLKEWFATNIKVRIVCEQVTDKGRIKSKVKIIDDSVNLNEINIRCGCNKKLTFGNAIELFRSHIESMYFTSYPFSRKMDDVYSQYSEMYTVYTDYACQRLSQDLTKLLDSDEGIRIRYIIGDLDELFSRMFYVDLEESII